VGQNSKICRAKHCTKVKHECRQLRWHAEMYPECVFASCDTLILLLDAENIERRVQLDAEKKSNVSANYKLLEKTVSHDMQICVSGKQFLSNDWLFTVYFTANFQTKAKKPLCFLITFLSRWCLVNYVWIPTCGVTFNIRVVFLVRQSATLPICKQQFTISVDFEFVASFPSEF